MIALVMVEEMMVVVRIVMAQVRNSDGDNCGISGSGEDGDMTQGTL